MKIKIFVLLNFLLFFTGCNDNVLVCEKNEKKPGYDYKENYKLIYDQDGDQLKKINLLISFQYNEYYTMEEIEDEYDIATNRCTYYEASSEKIKCSPSLENNQIKIDIVIKVEEISDSLFENIMYVTKNDLNILKESKKVLENVGYVCK